MAYLIRQMGIEDYDAVLKLWQASSSIVLGTIDSRECVARLLEKNTGLSFVAIVDDQIVGAVLCSQDGRLGYLSNLIVAPSCRRQGIGRQLVSRCMYALTGMGIHKCILLIMRETDTAINFWQTVETGGRVQLVMVGPR